MQWIHAYYVYILDSKLNNFVKEYMFNNTSILILKANNFHFNYRAENIKEAGWSRNYPSDLPSILGTID